jgi:hypothetical protein
MKQWFLLVLIAFVPIVILAAMFYSFGRYLVSVFDDWRELRQLDAIRAESEAIRAQLQQLNQDRLDIGCDHDFGGGVGFPPGVCPKCGLAQEKPKGDCDHVWRRLDGPVPASSCERCGKTYRRTTS